MSVTTSTAADLVAERDVLSVEVEQLTNELIAATEDVRLQKAADYDEKVNRLAEVNNKLSLASLEDKLKATQKALAESRAMAARPAPVSVQTTGFVTHNTQTGQTHSYGSHFEDPSEARSSYEYRKAFDAFCGARGKLDRIKSTHHRDMLERYGKSEIEPMGENEVFMPFRKDMILGSTNNGSNAVAPDFRFDVITPRTISPVMSRVCRVISTNVTSVTFPKNSDTNTAGQYGTSFRPYAGETPNTTASKIDTGPFTQLELTVKTGTMYTDVSADFLADAPGMSSYIQTEASKAFAAAVDDEVINATSSMAESILGCASIGITKTGVNNTLVSTKITDAYYSFYAQYGMNLAWVMRRATYGKVINLLDANNRSLYMPSSDRGYSQGANGDINGGLVYFNEFMPESSNTGLKKSIIVGDWNEYFLLLRQGFTVMIDDTSLQYANRIRVTSKYRFTGGVRDPKAFQIVHESA